MKSIVILLTVIIVLTDCTPDRKKYQAKNCATLFNFDQVDHFYSDIDDDKVSQLWEGKSSVPGDVQLADLVSDPLSNGLSDSVSLKGIQDLGFTEVLLAPPQLQQVANIFCSRRTVKTPVVKTNNCVPIWRDILVFRNEGTIVGIAKICFTCNQLALAGTNQEVTFGYYQEYGRLAKVLKRPHEG